MATSKKIEKPKLNKTEQDIIEWIMRSAKTAREHEKTAVELSNYASALEHASQALILEEAAASIETGDWKKRRDK